MKKGNFLTGKNLGGDSAAPTPDAIREMNRQITGKTVDAPAEIIAPPPAPEKTIELPERKVRITIDIPEKLHEALKFYTFRNKTTMKDLFLNHVAGLVAGEK